MSTPLLNPQMRYEPEPVCGSQMTLHKTESDACQVSRVVQTQNWGGSTCVDTPQFGWCGTSSKPISNCAQGAELLDGGLGAGLFELGLGSFGGFLGGLLEDGLRCSVDQILGFLQAEARNELADGLDDLDLLLAGGLEDDVELVLLLGNLSGGGRTGRAGNGNRCGGGDAQRVFELLHDIGELDEGELLEGLEQLVGGELRHDGRPFNFCVPARQLTQRAPGDGCGGWYRSIRPGGAGRIRLRKPSPSLLRC